MRLAGKKVQVDTYCQWCRIYHETDIHVLFECEMAKAVWSQVGLQGIINIMPEDSVFDVIRKMFELCTMDKCVLVASVCWGIWSRRNKWVWDRINMSAFGIKANALNMLADWKKAHENQSTPAGSRGGQIACRKWEKPPVDWVKINVDAALFEDIGSIGLGSIVRGAEGRFIAAMSRRRAGLIPPREAEALCLKSALLWLQTMGYRKCIYETDSQILARACQGVSGSSYFHAIVRDCIDLFQHFDDVKVCFVYRSANGAAHPLARAAYSLSGCQEWHENAPEFISDVLCWEIYK